MRIINSIFLKTLALLALALSLQTAAIAKLPDFTKLAEEQANAVVNISTTRQINTQRQFGLSREQLEQLGPWGDMFRHFFDLPSQGQGQRQQPIPQKRHHSLGSGFIISADGYIVTNNHVIDGADEIIVKLNDRRELVAELIGKDKMSDIALLKVAATDLPAVKMGSSENVQVGEWVLAIGSPFGFDASVTAGIVSAKGRALPDDNYVPFIQTDVAINPGNSGGPLFNLNGEVIGVNSQIYSRTGGFMGLSFSIPIDVALNVIKQLKDSGQVSRGWLGVMIQEVNKDLAESFGLKKPMGALVANVSADSPAAKAGLKTGDVIIKVNGKEVQKSSSLPPLIGALPVGSKVKLTVQRNKRSRVITVTLGELAKDEKVAANSKAAEKDDMGRLGIVVVEVDAASRSQLKIEKGAVKIDKIKRGAAAEAGLRRGDIITHLDNKLITSPKQFNAIIKKFKKGQVVPALVARAYGREFIAIRIP